MLWLTKTRLDILQEIVQLQTEMICPRGIHVKQINLLLKHALQNLSMNGLHFCDVGARRRLVQITDSGHITSSTCYPQEGRMVLLCRDHDELRSSRTEYYSGSWSSIFGGPTCPLVVSSKKAQRVSWSTSHSETNPAVSCAAMANIIASMFTEMEYVRLYRRAPSARDLP